MYFDEMPEGFKVITNAAEHRAALDEAERLILLDPAKGSAEGERLLGLADLIEAYEKKVYPLDAPAMTEAANDRNNCDIEAAEKQAALYDDDDRQDIKTDVMNSFYAGIRYARAVPPANEKD